MVRIAMIYDTSENGTVSHPIMSLELDDKVTDMLRSKEVHIEEITLFVGNEARVQIEDIMIEIKTSRINNDNGILRQLFSHKE